MTSIYLLSELFINLLWKLLKAKPCEKKKIELVSTLRSCIFQMSIARIKTTKLPTGRLL